MIRADHDWNRVFIPDGPIKPNGKPVTGTLRLLFKYLNFAHRIGSAVAGPLAKLPLESIAADTEPADLAELNLAFRNLARGQALRLATGQQMVDREAG